MSWAVRDRTTTATIAQMCSTTEVLKLRLRESAYPHDPPGTAARNKVGVGIRSGRPITRVVAILGGGSKLPTGMVRGKPLRAFTCSMDRPRGLHPSSGALRKV